MAKRGGGTRAPLADVAAVVRWVGRREIRSMQLGLLSSRAWTQSTCTGMAAARSVSWRSVGPDSQSPPWASRPLVSGPPPTRGCEARVTHGGKEENGGATGCALCTARGLDVEVMHDGQLPPAAGETWRGVILTAARGRARRLNGSVHRAGIRRRTRRMVIVQRCVGRTRQTVHAGGL
jgi:hypothetical protein